MFNGNGGLSASDVALLSGRDGGNGGMFGDGNGWWVIIIFALLFGWGGNGNGGGVFGGSRSGGVTDGYVLASDFANIERKIDTVNAGLCDGFYAMNTGMLNGFAGINNAITTNGYETRLATNGLGSQLASCCCDIREGIQANTTQGVMNTNAIQQQIAQCCCENEKMVLQSKYETAQANCATLQAIDKVGDRIIDYMAAEKAQALRDENQALRLKASQEAQNSYLISQLGYQCPKPAYVVQPPQQVTFPTTCGCNGNANFANFGGYGYNYGTTIA